MILYLFFDSSLSTCPKKMETEKWPKAAFSPLPVHNYGYKIEYCQIFLH